MTRLNVISVGFLGTDSFCLVLVSAGVGLDLVLVSVYSQTWLRGVYTGMVSVGMGLSIFLIWVAYHLGPD